MYNEDDEFDEAPSRRRSGWDDRRDASRRQESYSPRPNEARPGEVQTRLLGGLIKTDPAIAGIVNAAINTASPFIIARFSGLTNNNLHRVMKGYDPAKVAKAARWINEGFAVGLNFRDNAPGYFRSMLHTHKKLKELSQTIAPIIVAQHRHPTLRGLYDAANHNEVVADARDQVISRGKRDLMRDTFGLPSQLISYFIGRPGKPGNTPASPSPPGDLSLGSLDWKTAMIGPATLVTERWQEKYQEKADKIARAPSVVGMIDHLTKQMAEEPGRDNLVTPEGDEVSIKKYVKGIFNEHQRLHGQSEIGHRHEEAFDRACGDIAEAITEGRMSPMALVVLVGERKIVKTGGKALAPEKQIARAIEEQCTRLPASPPVDVEKYLQEAPWTLQDMAKALHESKGAKRDLFLAELPREVAARLGCNEEQHQLAIERVGTDLGKAIAGQLRRLDKHSDEALAKHYVPDEIGKIRQVVATIGKRGGMKELRQMLSEGADVGSVKFIVANSPLLWNPEAKAEHVSAEASAPVSHSGEPRGEESRHTEAGEQDALDDGTPDAVIAAGESRAHHGRPGQSGHVSAAR